MRWKDFFQKLQGIALSSPAEDSNLARKMRLCVLQIPAIHLPRRSGTQSFKGVTDWIRDGIKRSRQSLALRMQFHQK
jgi:hypothetical protein